MKTGLFLQSFKKLFLAASLCASASVFAAPIQVYTSTNVWASVVQHVGGKDVNVISGVTNINQDPHDFEPSAKDKLDISKSAFVVVNGGGYDDWASKLAESVANHPKVLDAVAISGLKPAASDEFNEHVFFSLATAKKVGAAVAEELTTLDPAHQAAFKANLANFDSKIDALLAKAKTIGEGHDYKGIYTEPVVGYLMTDMGIANITPEAFVEQSETDAGPSAKVLRDTEALLSGKQASILVLNAQTEDATSTALENAAKAAGIPIVYVYETFPNSINDYLDFVGKTINDFKTALSD